MHRQFTNALVVDDNKVCRLVAVTLLERLNFVVSTANNGLEALEATKKNRFSLVLMDCDMPELDGLDATRAIRKIETRPDHTVIIGVTSRADREDCLNAGMDDHIQKPLTLCELKQALYRWGWCESGPNDQTTPIPPRIYNQHHGYF